MKEKTYWRRAAALCLAALLTIGTLSGCGASVDLQKPSPDRLQVVTTIFPSYDFAGHIAGDCADVHMLLKPGEEVHSYEPTPQDIRMIQNCDLFIYTGGENDVWVENILSSVGSQTDSSDYAEITENKENTDETESEKSGPRAVRLLDLVDTYAEEELEGMMPEKGGHDHEHAHHEEAMESSDHEHAHHEEASEGSDHEGEDDGHDHDEEPDEHVWTSPENCVILIDKLTEELCSLDPEHAAEYRANGSAYRAEFEDLDAQYRQMAETASRKTILFGDRFPFRYLAEELGLTCYAAFSGCSAESEPSAATIAFLIDKAAQEGLPVVFRIEFSNGNIASAISEAAQIRVQNDIARSGSQSGKGSGVRSGSGLEAGNDSGDADKGAFRMQVLQLHSCHNLTRNEFESGETCLSLMQKNLEALRTALN